MRNDIGAVLGWKFNHRSGVDTHDGVITKFPGGMPSDADILLWTQEYDAYIASTKYKRDRAVQYRSRMPLPLQLEAIIEQMQADKDAGKIMVPAMENVLSIDSAIKENNNAFDH